MNPTGWLDVIQVDVPKLFKLVIDTGNAYLDAIVAIVLVAMLLGALVFFRGKRRTRKT